MLSKPKKFTQNIKQHPRSHNLLIYVWCVRTFSLSVYTWCAVVVQSFRYTVSIITVLDCWFWIQKCLGWWWWNFQVFNAKAHTHTRIKNNSQFRNNVKAQIFICYAYSPFYSSFVEFLWMMAVSLPALNDRLNQMLPAKPGFITVYLLVYHWLESSLSFVKMGCVWLYYCHVTDFIVRRVCLDPLKLKYASPLIKPFIFSFYSVRNAV